MHLTKEEERIYSGEQGWAREISMKILVRLGDLFDADKLISINSAHVSGVSYKTLGDAPIEFLKALADADCKVKVRTTLNPQSLDPDYLDTRVPANMKDKQLTILRQFERMGITQSLTCTPYYLAKSQKGSHLAWAESSAVVYANSVLGAYTNREGGPSALAAAIIGKTPNYGLHKARNRKPNILVNVETKLKNETEYGALGIFLGRILKDKIPLIEGLEKAPADNLKQLSAALASTGMTNMFQLKKNRTNISELERISVGARDIEQTIESLCTASTARPDLVFVGCPHCSFDEIKRVTRLAENRKFKRDLEFWICTSCHVKRRAKESVRKLEGKGGQVLAGVCTVVSWTETLGIKTIMTNSAKTAYYAPTLNKAGVILASAQECLKTVFEG